ncbi:MAG: hypothetical protein M1343_08490 [Chloroflexi bacterium]|nr:hypothetical protein [Chloroflexota bacterium]
MQRLSIGEHVFYVNPEEVAVSVKSNAVAQRTKGGESIQVFQADDETITITGTTANAGLKELEAIQQAIYPSVHILFIYPYKRMSRTVRVLSCVYTDSANNRPNLYQYRIELMVEKPPAGTIISALSTSQQNVYSTGSVIEIIAADGDDIASVIQAANQQVGNTLYTDYNSFEQRIRAINPDIKNWSSIPEGTKVWIPG